MGVCHKCEHPVCDEHAVVCAECGVACFECSSADNCTSCRASVCRFCMRVDENKRLKCSTCYMGNNLGPEDFGGSDYDMEEPIYHYGYEGELEYPE